MSGSVKTSADSSEFIKADLNGSSKSMDAESANKKASRLKYVNATSSSGDILSKSSRAGTNSGDILSSKNTTKSEDILNVRTSGDRIFHKKANPLEAKTHIVSTSLSLNLYPDFTEEPSAVVIPLKTFESIESFNEEFSNNSKVSSLSNIRQDIKRSLDVLHSVTSMESGNNTNIARVKSQDLTLRLLQKASTVRFSKLANSLSSMKSSKSIKEAEKPNVPDSKNISIYETIKESQGSGEHLNIISLMYDHVSLQWMTITQDDQHWVSNLTFQSFIFYTILSVWIFLYYMFNLLGSQTFTPVFLIFTANYLLFQVSRICYHYPPTRILPLYLSTIGIFISSSFAYNVVDILFSVCWFMQLLIHFQLFLRYMSVHAIFYTAIMFVVLSFTGSSKVDFGCENLVNPELASSYYTSSQLDIRFAFCLRKTSEYRALEEIICFMFVMGSSLSMMLLLMRFLRQYAVSMMVEIDNIVALEQQNTKLIKELKTLIKRQEAVIEKENEIVKNIDLKSPLYLAISKIQEVRSATNDAAISTTLTAIINVLGSGNLFSVNLDNTTADEQVQNWLKTLLTPEQASSTPKTGLKMLNEAKPSPSITFGADQSTEYYDQSQIKEYLEMNGTSLKFDSFQFCTITNGQALSHFSIYLFQKYNLFDELGLDPNVFERCIVVIENSYFIDIPYHNSIHALDVLQYMSFIMTDSIFLERFKPIEIMSAFFACMIHDLQHPGVTNGFLVETNNPFAILYNDKSVLENFHASTAFTILKKNNFLSSASKEVYSSFREMVIALVLATDMSFHFEFIGRIKAKLSGENGIDWNSANDKKLVLQICIKLSDINNPTRTWRLSQSWAYQIMEEFFTQGEAEADANIPISSFFNRETSNISKCQIGFIDFIVRPLFDSIAPLLPLPACHENMKNNRQNWLSTNTDLLKKEKLPLKITPESFPYYISPDSLKASKLNGSSIAEVRQESFQRLRSKDDFSSIQSFAASDYMITVTPAMDYDEEENAFQTHVDSGKLKDRLLAIIPASNLSPRGSLQPDDPKLKEFTESLHKRTSLSPRGSEQVNDLMTLPGASLPAREGEKRFQPPQRSYSFTIANLKD